MKLSHSKLSLLLSNPMEYYLSYRMGISPKFEKPALSIGSATHWGIEHDTEDLTEYFGDRDNYGRDQLLAEAMVHGYRFHKNQIFDELLSNKDGTKMQLIQETHELFINGKLKSFKYPEPHIFVGIIDLLLLTDEGFIIVDYKTSSMIPNWDDYLDQLYRYIFLIESEFPGVPVKKIAIINLKKSRAKMTRGESNASFLNRLKKDYEINDDSSVNWHIFDPNDLDKKFIDLYIDNLSRMADTAQSIDMNNMWFINWSSTNSYGGSVYKNIIYHVPDCYVLYNIKDEVYDKYTKEVKKIRACRPIDMQVIDKPNILNKYSEFEENALSVFSSNDVNKEKLFDFLKKKFICDDKLLEEYWDTFLYKMQSS